MGELIEYLFLAAGVVPALSIQQLWDNGIRPIFTSLSYADFSDWLARSGDGQGYLRDMAIADLRRYIACNLQMFNDRVGQWLGKGTKPFNCVCYGTNCCRSDEACPNPNLKRLAQGRGVERRQDITLERRDKLDSALTRRANNYDWSATWNGVTYTGSYTALLVRQGPALHSIGLSFADSLAVALSERFRLHRLDMATCLCAGPGGRLYADLHEGVHVPGYPQLCEPARPRY
jgi:hypothetical protein